MNHKVARNLRWLLSAVILAFLVVFARTIDWGAAWSSMRHASLPLLVAAIGVNFVSMLKRTWSALTCRTRSNTDVSVGMRTPSIPRCSGKAAA